MSECVRKGLPPHEGNTYSRLDTQNSLDNGATFVPISISQQIEEEFVKWKAALALLLAVAAGCSSSPTDVGPVTHDAGGVCTTVVNVTAVAPLTMAFTGTCTLKELGQVTLAATQTVDDKGVMANTTPYTTANGKVVRTTFTGQVVSQSQTGDVAFTGVETYVSGTGAYVGVSGSSTRNGTATVDFATSHGVGQYTTAGSIKY